ncbi:UPF0389 protein CG9231 isoform X1 [Anoplophora glabripennis]|uniref:UPF0389 protein CG9231 isoform X1 n=1 Tax=Anoplophora glabripennis TaxID=217634 RepID=UPI000875398B|nr:UPF0389 protein CG9231 isoform X1 [Anoplophora glabripennis]
MTSFLHSIFVQKPKILGTKTGVSNAVRLVHGKVEASSHKVDKLEKRFLVWTGKYKKIEDVPNFVSQSTIERARNRMRIRIANYMMLATAVGCIIMIYSGKQAAKRGESVQKQNIEWHRKIKEEAKAE